MDRPETCPTCNRWTQRGLQQLRERSKPLYGTDLSKPISELIEGVRSQLVQSRGQLSDIGHRYSGWEERVKDIEGLLTCGLVALHRIKQEALECEKRFPQPILSEDCEVGK